MCADANDRPVAHQLRRTFTGVRSRQLMGRAAGENEKVIKRVTIMNKSNHSTAPQKECNARILACRSGRNPCRLEELRARMLAEQAGKTPDLPWGQWRPSSQCAAKIRKVLAAFEKIGKLFAVALSLTLTCVLHGSSTPVFSWNTSKVARGSHTLKAVAYDAVGNSNASTVVTVYK